MKKQADLSKDKLSKYLLDCKNVGTLHTTSYSENYMFLKLYKYK